MKRILKRVFLFERHDIKGVWTKLQNAEHHNLTLHQISINDGGEWLHSLGNNPGTNWIGSRVGLRARVGAVEKRKSLPHGPARGLITIPSDLPAP
jgi:hypothetical protein